MSAAIISPELAIFIRLKDLLNTRPLSATNIVTIAAYLMSFIEQYSELSGIQKKKLVCDAISKYINEQIQDPELKAILLLLVDTVLPGAIDALSYVDKDMITIEKKITNWCCGSNK